MNGKGQISCRPCVASCCEVTPDGLVGPVPRNHALLDFDSFDIKVGSVVRGFLKERQAGNAVFVRDADEDILVGGLAEFESQAALGTLGSEGETGECADG